MSMMAAYLVFCHTAFSSFSECQFVSPIEQIVNSECSQWGCCDGRLALAGPVAVGEEMGDYWIRCYVQPSDTKPPT